MAEVHELTPSELEAVGGGGIIRWTELGCVECPKTVAEAWNAFYDAANLPKPFP